MRKVRCYECGKQYDYDEDGFCPACGAFNQPPRTARISPDGAVVRVDGINERNHADSFVHRELHAEDEERRRGGLEQRAQRLQKPATGRQRGQQFQMTPRITGSRTRKESKNELGILVGIIFGIIVLNILANFFYIFF